jgi:ABC-2 type transport system permease protein
MRIHRIYALLLKYWYISINKLDRIFDITYWPIVTLLVFGFTAQYIKGEANIPHIVIYLIGGMLLWLIFQRIQQDVVVYLLEDFWNQNLGNTFITPITSGEIFVSLCILSFIRSMISFILMTIIAALAYSFFIFQGGILPFVFIFPMFIFAWGIGFFIAGLIFRHGTQIQVFAWSMNFIFQPISGVYYPIETLPVFLQKIAFFIPLSHVFEGFRAAYIGNFNINTFIISLILAVIYFVIGYIFLMISIKKAKKTGIMTKY